jgi:manganese/zinc/iron transport system substrate-binding protein
MFRTNQKYLPGNDLHSLLRSSLCIPSNSLAPISTPLGSGVVKAASCWAGLFLLLIAGCGEVAVTGNESASTQKSAKSRPLIVTTTSIIADLVRNIVEEEATVESLMGSGVDPHLYRPTRTDIQRLAKADVIVSNGLHLEGPLEENLAGLKSSGKTVFAMSDGLAANQLRFPGGPGAPPDPHIWMDVTLWQTAASYLANQLGDRWPNLKPRVATITERYLDQLAMLDQFAAISLGSIPADQRVLVTSHDAFGYMGLRYNITVRPVQGISTDSEAGIRDVNELVEMVIKQQIPTLFGETSTSSKAVEAVLAGAKARGANVQLGSPLFSDALGAEGTYKGTYIGMIDWNITQVTTGLGGRVAPRLWHQSTDSP